MLTGRLRVSEQDSSLALIRVSTLNWPSYAELTKALRISMEEERARQETSNPGTATGAQPDMDQELARALQMSMGHVFHVNKGPSG